MLGRQTDQSEPDCCKTPQNQQKENGETKKEKGEENQQ
jgi:hypothetical protein